MRDGGVVLGIDLATTYGWALGAPGQPQETGHGRFAAAAGNEGAVAFSCLRWANDFFVLNKPAVAFVEEPLLIQNRGPNRRPENPATLKRLWGLSVVVQAVAYGRGLYDVRTVHADAVRRHFIGLKRGIPGDKAKALVQERCTQLGWAWATADEADALAVWAYGCEQVRPGSGHAFVPSLFAAPRARAPQVRLTAKQAAELLFTKGRR